MDREKTIPALSIALFISLAANIFSAGHFVRLMADHYWSDKAQDYTLREQLSPDDRAVLEAAVAANRAKMDKLRSDIAAARDKELAITRTAPLDHKALEASLNEERAYRLKALTLLHETRQQVAAKMSPAGRTILQQMRRLGFATGAADPVIGVLRPASSQ